MSRLIKILFGLSILLLVLSIPTCQWGERTVKSEMAKYPPDFVAQHEFDLIFAQWVLPGIMMFSLGGMLAFVALVLWFVSKLPRSGK